MANAGILDLNQHFARSGAFQVDSFNGKRFASLPGDGGFGLHLCVL